MYYPINSEPAVTLIICIDAEKEEYIQHRRLSISSQQYSQECIIIGVSNCIIEPVKWSRRILWLLIKGVNEVCDLIKNLQSISCIDVEEIKGWCIPRKYATQRLEF